MATVAQLQHLNLNPGAKEWTPPQSGDASRKAPRRRPARKQPEAGNGATRRVAAVGGNKPPRSAPPVRSGPNVARPAGGPARGRVHPSKGHHHQHHHGHHHHHGNHHHYHQGGYLKVHAPNCDCARLKRQRDREKGRESSEDEAIVEPQGYLVVSRDLRTPEMQYVAVPPEKGAVLSRRETEAWLSDAITASVSSDAMMMPPGGPRMSCAACLLDGDWRNGAVVLAGSPAAIQSACDAANNALIGGDEPSKTRCVAVGLGALKKATLLAASEAATKLEEAAQERAAALVAAATAATDVDSGSSSSEAPTCVTPPVLTTATPDLVRVVSHAASADLRASLTARKIVLADDATVEVKHHVQEALEIVDFPEENALDEHLILVRAYVDSHGHAALELPGGKRRLGETAWEAAAREMADECALKCFLGDDPLTGTQGELRTRDARFKVDSYVDGQSVRFFLLKPAGEQEASSEVETL